MRKLFIVLGSSSNSEEKLCEQIIEEIKESKKENVCLIKIRENDPQPALRRVLEAIRPYANNYNDILVIYSGENLFLLHDNLPCDKLDISKLKSKIIEVVGGFQFPRDKEIVTNVFSAVVLRLLDPRPIKNLRQLSQS